MRMMINLNKIKKINKKNKKINNKKIMKHNNSI